MGKADALSRMTGLEMGENDNKDIVLLKPEFFICSIELEYPENELLEKIKQNKNIEKEIKNALNAGHKDWKEENGIIYWKNHIYVPVDRELQGKIIQNHHDTPLAGHPGQYKTWELIT